MIIALIADSLLLAVIAIVAGNYYRFWHRYCQENEPFTRHFSRWAEAFPKIWWPLNYALAVFSGLTAIFAPWYWAIIGAAGCGFIGWFIPHIKGYVSDHQADNPPNKTRGFRTGNAMTDFNNLKIPDLTVTDLTKNIICLLIITATLLLYIQGWPVPVELKLISGTVLAGYGINVAQAAVAQAKDKTPKEAPPESTP
jgi:hypothetical protein